MPWKPGESGNPGGRPKRTEALAIAISEMDEKYRERLDAIALKGEDRDSIAAIKVLWAYAHGNPVQAVTGKDGAPLVPPSNEAALEAARLLVDRLAQAAKK